MRGAPGGGAWRVYLTNVDYVLTAPARYDRAESAFATHRRIPLVPVLRAYGATPSGERCCVHVHNVFPYCYVEYTGALVPDAVLPYIQALGHALNRALAHALHQPSRDVQLIAAIHLCKGTPFYGYVEEQHYYLKISYVDQNRENIDPEQTVWEVVSDGLDYIHVGQNEMPSRAYLSAFGFKGPDQQKPSKVLSGGERNRLNLALTLKQGGNLILLDEPTNDLDVETLGSLENALQNFPGCAVVISHDRWFLDRTCTHILAWEGNVEEGKWFWFEGNFGDYEANKVERLGEEAAKPSRVTHRKLTR